MAAVKAALCRQKRPPPISLPKIRAKEVLKMESKFTAFSELPIILNATDVASILGVSRAFAYNLFHADDFPVIVIGSRRLVNKDSFINWLNQKEGAED